MWFDWHYCPEPELSTQDLAMDWMRAQGNARGESGRLSQDEMGCMCVFHTFSQQKGRGQAGNAWYCGRGRNIALTLGFCPVNLDSSLLFVLDMALSLGVLRYARRSEASCCLKWPNDVYAGMRKLAGILMETRIEGPWVRSVCLGVGVNVNQEVFPEWIPNPVSFKQLDGRHRELESESRQLAEDLAEAALLFMENRKSRTGQDLFLQYKEAYLAALLFYGQYQDFCFRGETVRARIEDVDEDGRLRLCTGNGRWIEAGIKELRYCLPG